MNKHRLVVLGYVALCTIAASTLAAQPIMAEETPSPQVVPANSGDNERIGNVGAGAQKPVGDMSAELKNNLEVPPPGSDEAQYLSILKELGDGDHHNVPKLLEICARHKEKNSFVRMSPAMLAAYQRNYLLEQKAHRSTVALASVASFRHFMRVEDAQKLRIAIEDWQISPERLGLQPKELQFIKEHTADGRDIKLPIVKQRSKVVPSASPVLASRHAQAPLTKSVKKPEVKPDVKRRRRSVMRDAAMVDIRPAPSRKEKSTH